MGRRRRRRRVVEQRATSWRRSRCAPGTRTCRRRTAPSRAASSREAAVTDRGGSTAARRIMVMLQSLCPPGGSAPESRCTRRSTARGRWNGRRSSGRAALRGRRRTRPDSGRRTSREGFDAEKLQAELKARRYFAVAAFDAPRRPRPSTRPATASRSGDVRAPEPVVHSRRDDLRRRAEAHEATSAIRKPPKARVCAARQQTKVKCTFDDDDGHRQHAIEEMLKDPDAATASRPRRQRRLRRRRQRGELAEMLWTRSPRRTNRRGGVGRGF